MSAAHTVFFRSATECVKTLLLKKCNIPLLEMGLELEEAWVAEATISSFQVGIEQSRNQNSEDSVAVREYS